MIDLVIKIGSMALIQKQNNDIDYNIFSRLSASLRPGMVLVSSGATEIGRLDYIKRTGKALEGDLEHNKTDYAAQGQAILMELYRRFVPPQYSVRQVLVEHNHFNNPLKRKHLYELLMRCAEQNAIPIINYNDAINDEENRKLEIDLWKQSNPNEWTVECVDNDETAAVVSELLQVKKMILLTMTQGIYKDPSDPSTLVENVYADNKEALTHKIRALQSHCHGASRQGANGAKAKLEYALRSAMNGVEVTIASAKDCTLEEILSGKAHCTRIGVKE